MWAPICTFVLEIERQPYSGPTCTGDEAGKGCTDSYLSKELQTGGEHLAQIYQTIVAGC